MLRTLAAVALALLLALPARAQSGSGAIEDVIASQIEAFRQDDFATAFGFASPAIRRLFRTPERFGAMVRSGYPMVYRPGEITWLGLRERGKGMTQRVLIADGEGRVHTLAYDMVETENGWRIDGVRIVEDQFGA